MTLILTRAQVRQLDRRAIEEYGISGLVLMENAGRGVADVLCKLLKNPSPSGRGQGEGAGNPAVVIVCGKGNNGGDGFVIARHLDLRGISVRVLLLADPKDLIGDAAANYQIIAKAGLRIVPFAASEISRRHMVSRCHSWHRRCRRTEAAAGRSDRPNECPRCAHSRRRCAQRPGLRHGRRGKPHHPRRPHLHLRRRQAGVLRPGAGQYVGQLHVLDIGAPRKLLEEIDSPPRR